MPSLYGPAAKHRIAQMGEAEIGRFIDEVPLATRTKIFNELPRVPGFRPKQEMTVRRKRFIARLTEDNAKHAADGDWAVLHRFWVEWGCSTFGKSARAVLERQTAAGIANGVEAAVSFLAELKESIGSENLVREDVGRLLQFGSYDDATSVNESIGSLPTRAQKEKERRLEALAPKLDELAAQVARIETAWRSGLESVTVRLVATEALLDQLAQSATELGTRAEEQKRWSEAFRQEVRQLAGDVSVLRDEREAARAELIEQLGAAREDAASAIEQVAALRGDVDVVKRRSLDTVVAFEQFQDHVAAGASEDQPTANRGVDLIEWTKPTVVWTEETLGQVLFKASPATNPGLPRLLVIDAALRARELPLLIGPLAREFAEAWLAIAGGADPVVMSTDPTLLSLQELTPRGSRGDRAPLAVAFSRARSDAQRPIVVVLDDLDPAAAGFWLPELARACRQPSRYGFPPNLVFIALLEGDASQMGLSQTRAAELFPLTFTDCTWTGTKGAVVDIAEVGELSFELLVRLTQSSSAARVAAIEASAQHTFGDKDRKSLSMGLASFLDHAKGFGPPPGPNDAVGNCLLNAARLLVREQ